MFCALNLQHRQLSTASSLPKCVAGESFSSPRRLIIRSPRRNFSLSASLRSESSNNNASTTSSEQQPQQLTAAVGYPSSTAVVHWNPTQRHVTVLSFIAGAAAISATWLFFSAIPTLLAFKRAAESLEKLMDVTREELPDTMAAVRLSGMEISDLTMELSDLGQEITRGVRSSTRAVRLAEERLHRLTNMTPPASMQDVAPIETKTSVPVVAKTARGIREAIVKGRSVLQIFFTLTRFSKVAFKFFTSRAKA